MAAITFASRLNEDGSLTIPQNAAEKLGLHPGDEVEVRLETKNGMSPIATIDYDQVIAELLAEAQRIQPEPGKPGSDPHEAAFGEIMKEKYRKQGFRL
jgi:bifunctional DNA-binding transcriptional regulator/antitoxin component of YhaV-PrlF toxin-antitoxin module